MNSEELFYKPNDSIVATVGNNGYHSILEYADGFFEGAEFIIWECVNRLENRKRIINGSSESRIDITEDIIVYPVCFCIRHSIELYLKEIVSNIFKIYDFKNQIYDKCSLEHHDINKLWNVIKECHFNNWDKNSNIDRNRIFDSEFDEYIDKLDSYISIWGTIDPTGQTFRYPFSNTSQKHLENQDCISVLHLFLESRKYHKLLKSFSDSSIYLKDDYQKGKYTKCFTYRQLCCIADSLPCFSTWNKDSANLTNIIDVLAKKYKVSIRKIKEEAINQKIKKDSFLASKIGIDISFKFISIDEVTEIYKFFHEINVKYNHSHNLVFDHNLTNRLCELDKIAKVKKVSEIFLSEFSLNKLIDLLTLCYMGRYNDDLYEYEKIYEFISENFNSIDKVITKINEKILNVAPYIKNALDIFGKK